MARIRGGRRTDRTRWEADNRLALNPGPFLAIGAFVALLAGLAVLLWLFD
jgi:hypothetical protein